MNREMELATISPLVSWLAGEHGGGWYVLKYTYSTIISSSNVLQNYYTHAWP